MKGLLRRRDSYSILCACGEVGTISKVLGGRGKPQFNSRDVKQNPRVWNLEPFTAQGAECDQFEDAGHILSPSAEKGDQHILVQQLCHFGQLYLPEYKVLTMARSLPVCADRKTDCPYRDWAEHNVLGGRNSIVLTLEASNHLACWDPSVGAKGCSH